MCRSSSPPVSASPAATTPPFPPLTVACATLHCANSTPLSATRPSNSAHGAALDHCFLVDRVVEGDRPFVAARAAARRGILIVGFVVALLVSDLRNEPRARALFQPAHREDSEFPPTFGLVNGLGYVAVRLPLDALVTFCSRREAHRLITNGLLGDAPRFRDGGPQRAHMPGALAPMLKEARLRLLEPAPGVPSPRLDDLSPVAWANELCLVREEWQAAALPALAERLDERGERERQELLAAIRHGIDTTVQGRAHGGGFARLTWMI